MENRSAPELFKMDGQVVLVTGGSKGLGEAMALGLAEAGATTIISSRNQELCDQVAANIAEKSGQESIGIAVDVTSEESVKSLFATVMEKYGRLDVLINSAGINVRAQIDECSLEDFQNVIDINLTGTWLCCREAAKIMKPQKKGSVINMGSALSRVGMPARTPYCSSKAGVLGMTQVLSLEWAPFGVRCNVVCPGPFLTEMNKPLLKEPEKAKAVLDNTAYKRWAEMHEITGVGLFLASDASTYVTGTTLSVDGGWTAK